MKRTLLLAWAVLLSVIAGVQTAMAQKVTLYSAGSKAYECDIAQLDSITFDDTNTEPEEDEYIYVKVYEDGSTSNGSIFSAIDDKNFYIDYIKYTVTEGHLAVSGYDKAGFKGVAKIISKLTYKGNTYEVLGIGNKAFEDCRILTSITIPSKVTSIGDYAFRDCSSLTSVTIPESVTSISNYAFCNCSSLTSITIPESVTSIGEYAFADCTGLTSITIPNSVIRIGNYAFGRCSGLTSITIGSGVTSIGMYAFSDCSNLTDVYCYAENVPTDIGIYYDYGIDAFGSSPIGSVTLHVPAGSVDAYKATEPWKYFKSIVAI